MNRISRISILVLTFLCGLGYSVYLKAQSQPQIDAAARQVLPNGKATGEPPLSSLARGLITESGQVIGIKSANYVVNLTADNQVVQMGANTRIALSSDNATAANRTFTLGTTGAVVGQTYILQWVHASNQGEMADTGIQRLSAAWTPGQFDTLCLLWDGSNWVELARANN